MRRNNVVIKLRAKSEVDEALVAEYGEEEAIRAQREGIEDMLGEYSVFMDFDVEIDVTLDEEEALND